ncbi:MAG: hypothetical protein AAGK01_04030, partial [Pseudomonadota bacterium]
FSSRMLEGAIGKILASTDFTEVTRNWADPSSTTSMIGAATSAAAAGMASWLGDSSVPNLRRHREMTPGYEPSNNSRYLITPGIEEGETVVLILDPDMEYSQSRKVTSELMPNMEDLHTIMDQLREDARMSPSSERSESGDLLATLDPAIAAMLTREVRPQIIATSMPRMEQLCVPSPHEVIICGEERSTGGVYCRDSDGRFGITGCFHGTGPVGTKVEVGLREYKVALANPVQDIVFIPLGDDYNIPELQGCNGLVTDRAPGQQERATFEGSTSEDVTETIISSHDAGLLRRRSSVQLKLQTRPDAQRGDSGSALVDQNDKVMAFAFERTAFGEYPEFTDWIWADNAMAALGLTPYTTD